MEPVFLDYTQLPAHHENLCLERFLCINERIVVDKTARYFYLNNKWYALRLTGKKV